jgi:ESS family glutamate:Na+ symporter
VLIAAFGGFLMSRGMKLLIPSLELPIFSCAFVVGLIFKSVLDWTKASEYVCKKTTSHISSFATDLLVACGVASIKLGVVVKYIVPLAILIVIGIVVVFFSVFFFGKRFMKEDWFEKSIFAWGWWTGTMAMGIALLRIVDPENSSKSLDDYALAYLPCAPVEILLISLVPILFVNGYGALVMSICLVLSLLILLLSYKMGWYRRR